MNRVAELGSAQARPSVMKRAITYSVVGLLVLLVVLALRLHVPDPAKIQRGDSESRVLRLLGRPDEVSGSPPEIMWGQNPIGRRVNSGECVREFTYRRSGTRGHRSWHIGFDARSNVVSNYRWDLEAEPRVTSP